MDGLPTQPGRAAGRADGRALLGEDELLVAEQVPAPGAPAEEGSVLRLLPTGLATLRRGGAAADVRVHRFGEAVLRRVRSLAHALPAQPWPPPLVEDAPTRLLTVRLSPGLGPAGEVRRGGEVHRVVWHPPEEAPRSAGEEAALGVGARRAHTLWRLLHFPFGPQGPAHDGAGGGAPS
jgi:hypothetical protein